MSYCRFENTLSDLEDCIQAINDRDSLSEREADALEAMLQAIGELLEDEGLVDELPDDFKKRVQQLVKRLKEKEGED
jgi:GTP cyclohydrolase I